MTDRPMDASTTDHPDEGLIHAWLDDALGAAEAARIEAHVRDCAECQARVAEARGLIAGASRIVAALDDAPAGTRPGWATSAATSAGAASGVTPITQADPLPQRSLWRWLRVTPGRAALAATILVAIGITLTHEQVAVDSVRSVTSTFNQGADVPAATPAEGGAADGAKEALARDELLDSAVAGNVARTQGQSRIEAAPGLAIPQAPPPSPRLDMPAGAGAERVARGRAVAEAQRETTGVTADRLRVGRPAPVAATAAAPAPQQATEGAGAGSTVRAQTRVPTTPPSRQDAMMAAENVYSVAKACVRIDSPDADARWADQRFPIVLAIDSGSATAPRNAAVLTVAGQPTELRATWRPGEGDSVSVTLRRIGYSGAIVLGPDQGARSGVARSSSAPSALQEEVVAVVPSAQSRARAEGAREEARKSAAAPQPVPAPGPPVRQLRVTARTVPCP